MPRGKKTVKAVDAVVVDDFTVVEAVSPQLPSWDQVRFGDTVTVMYRNHRELRGVVTDNSQTLITLFNGVTSITLDKQDLKLLLIEPYRVLK